MMIEATNKKSCSPYDLNLPHSIHYQIDHHSDKYHSGQIMNYEKVQNMQTEHSDTQVK